jgi:hypothetical protein
VGHHYIQNCSLRLELRALVLTIAEIMRFRDGKPPTPERRLRLADSTSGPACAITSFLRILWCVSAALPGPVAGAGV